MQYLSKTAQKIFQALVDNPLRKFKATELISAAGTGKGVAGKLIDYFIDEDIVKIGRIGKTKIVSLHLTNPATFLLKNIFALEKLRFLSEEKLAAVQLFKQEVQPFASLLVLFGSTTAGTATPSSDIDLLVVSDNFSKVELARKKIEESIGQRLNLHLNSEQEVRENVAKDSFLQNVLLQGVILSGYDLAQILYISLEKEEPVLDRLFYFQERIRAARRNYLQKDNEGTQEIIARLEEQLIFYILSCKSISYESKKDAFLKIKKLPEVKSLFKAVSLKEKINILETLVQQILISQLLGKDKYGFAPRN